MNLQYKELEKLHYDKDLSRILEHLEFHDWRYGSQAVRASLRRGYAICENLVAKICKGKQVLDFGCGTGLHSIYIAKKDAFVTGIDISEVAIKIANIFANREKVNDRCNFIIGDAEKTEFSDNVFDIVFNSGSMSCLNIDKALSEVCRILRPDGMFIGIDTLGYNPFLNLNRYLKYRRGNRTKHTIAHILRMSDLDKLKSHFKNVSFRYFDLTTFFGIPFERFPKIHSKLHKLCANLDDLLFHSFLKRYAFKVLFVLSQPKKELKSIDKATI